MEEWIWISVILLICCVFIFGIFVLHDNEGIAEYNGGVCKVCGGHYVYEQTIGHAYTTEYIYICDRCGNMIHAGRYLGR